MMVDDIPNNLDDYGFLTCRGLILDKNYGNKTNSHSVDDLLLDVNKNPSRLIFGERHQNDALINRNRKSNGSMHSRLSTSQPSLNKYKKLEKRTIKVRFEVSEINNKENKNGIKKESSRNIAETDHEKSKETNQKNAGKDNRSSKKKQFDNHKKKDTWWKHIFRSNKSKADTKKENDVMNKTAKTNEQKQVKRDKVNESIEIIENLSFSELDGKVEKSENHEAGSFLFSEKSNKVNRSTGKDKNEIKRTLEIKKLVSSPVMKRRIASADNLLSLSQEKDTLTNMESRRISKDGEYETIPNNIEKVSRKSSKKENKSIVLRKQSSKKLKSKFSFKTGSKRNSIQFPLETESDIYNRIGDKSSKAFHDYDDVCEETHLKSLYVPEGSTCSSNSVYEKYPANKGMQRKVLVHIHTNEEMPIKDGIPQWVDLPYQCASALQHRHKRGEPSLSRRKLIRPELIESSFVGVTSIQTSLDKNENVEEKQEKSKNEDTEFFSETTMELSKNTSTVKVLVHKTLNDDNVTDSKCEMASSSVADCSKQRAAKYEKEEIISGIPKGPSYFEVTTDRKSTIAQNTATMFHEKHGANNAHETERSFALTGMATDEIPDIIAKRHPYLASSGPLRHMAKCIRQAPIAKPVEKLSPTRSEKSAQINHIDNDVRSLITADRSPDRQCLSDSEYSTFEYTPLKIPQMKETNLDALNHKKTSPKSGSNTSLERIKETNEILVRMKERIQRLESISDESNACKTEQKQVNTQELREHPARNDQMKTNMARQPCCVSNNLMNMASLPLPFVKTAMSSATDVDFTSTGNTECNPAITGNTELGQKNSKHNLNFRKLLYRKIQERSTHNNLVSQTCLTASRETLVTTPEKITSDFSTSTTPCDEGSTKVDEVSRKRNQSFEITPPTMTSSPKLPQVGYEREQNVISIANETFECSAQPVSSPTRRRLRIMPFTLPLPKNTRYSSDGIFGESQFGIDRDDVTYKESNFVKCTNQVTKTRCDTDENLKCQIIKRSEHAFDEKTPRLPEGTISTLIMSENSAFEASKKHCARTTNTTKSIEAEINKHIYPPSGNDHDKANSVYEHSKCRKTIKPPSKHKDEKLFSANSSMTDNNQHTHQSSSTEYVNYDHGYLDEVTGRYISDFEPITENCGNDRLQDIIFQQEQIRSTILNEMHLVKSRYSQADEDEFVYQGKNNRDFMSLKTYCPDDNICPLQEVEDEFTSDDETLCDSVETVSVLEASDDSMVTQQGSESSCYRPICFNDIISSESKLHLDLNNLSAFRDNCMPFVDNDMPKAIESNHKPRVVKRYWRTAQDKNSIALNGLVCDDYETDL